MTDISKATPRPWNLGSGRYQGAITTMKCVVAQLTITNNDLDEAAANAALIVRSVNERDELIAALQTARARLHDLHEDTSFLNAILAKVQP